MSQYQVGGSVSEEYSFYIEREADQEIDSALRKGELVYVFNSRQMGKSSLLLHTKSRLSREGFLCSFIDVSLIASGGISREQWYGGMVSALWRSYEVGTSGEFVKWWKAQGEIPPSQILGLFFDKLLRAYPDQDIVIFFDEIDSTLGLAFAADDFFSVIRASYNNRAENSQYRRLNFAFFGVALPSDLIADKKRSPFNIGKAISLEGFSESEAQPLARLLATETLAADKILSRVIYWSGGQPFLTQKICQLLADSKIQSDDEVSFVDLVVSSKILVNWEANDNPEHLKTIRDRMVNDTQFATQNLSLYQQLLSAPDKVLDTKSIGDYQRFYLTGMIRVDGTKVSPRSRLYQKLFDIHWVRNELQRLRPYGEKIEAWLNAKGNRSQYLLNARDLEIAKEWAEDKNLGEADYRYLSASQDAEKLKVHLWNEKLQEEVASRKQAEAELQNVLSELEKAKSEAEKANQAKSDFLAMMSHEVRTPINNVLGLSYLGMQQHQMESAQEYLRKVHSAAGYMQSIVSDILDLGKIEKGELTVKQQRFLLDDVFNKLFDVIGIKVAAKKLGLVLELPEKPVPFLLGDPELLERILFNLLNDLIQTTETGTIVARLSFNLDDERVMLDFDTKIFNGDAASYNSNTMDNGPFIMSTSVPGQAAALASPGIGISLSRQLVSMLGGEFEAFTLKDGTYGSRLSLPFGLSAFRDVKKHDHELVGIVAQNQIAAERLSHLVKLCGFQATDVKLDDILELDPAMKALLVSCDWTFAQAELVQLIQTYPQLKILPVLDVGQVLPHWLAVLGIQSKVELPTTPSRLESIIVKSVATEALQVEDNFNEQFRVLVAEDDEINQQIIQELLTQCGLSCKVVGNGKLAIEALEKESFDLVLMDIEMPVMNGVEAVRHIREMSALEAHANLKQLPVIALTAHAMKKDKQRYLASGMNDYISKPVEPDLLVKVIGGWLPMTKSVNLPPGEQEILSVNGLDTNAGLMRCGGNQQIYTDLLLQFAHRYQQGLPEINGEGNTLATLCHTLKGSAGNLGAVAISELASTIETSLKQGEEISDNQLTRLSTELMRLSRTIKQQLVRDETVAESHEETAEILRQFLSELEQDFAAAEATMVKLQSGSRMNKLKQTMQDFDTQEAKQIAEEWLSKVVEKG